MAKIEEILSSVNGVSRYLQQVKAEPGYPAGSSRGTSAGRGSSGHGRWGECAAARRRDRLTRCSPLSLQLSLHWGVEAERRNDMRGTVTLIGERLYSLYNPP